MLLIDKIKAKDKAKIESKPDMEFIYPQNNARIFVPLELDGAQVNCN